jgi:hypothetical protein
LSLYIRLFTSYFLENFGSVFFEKTAGGQGLTIQGFYVTDGPIPIIAAKDIGKFALIAFKNPEKYIGRPLTGFSTHACEKF